MKYKIVGGDGVTQPLATHFPSSSDVLTIYQAVSECSPFSQTGGLAMVPRGLAEGLTELGHDVSIFVPQHTGTLAIAAADLKLPIERFQCKFSQSVSVYGSDYPCNAFSTTLPYRDDGLHYILIDSGDHGTFVSRGLKRVYGHGDDAARFYILSQIVAQMISPGPRTVVHSHDWQTGYLPLLLKTKFLDKGLPTLHTIHNLKHTKRVSREEFWNMTGLADASFPQLYSEHGINFPGGSDMADPSAAAFRIADAINTVSETYARETLGDEAGEGYQWLLGQRFSEGRYTGITNGVDSSWYPNFDHTNFAQAKAEAKAEVQGAFGLPRDPSVFLMMMASRFDAQKGYELVNAILTRLINEAGIDLQFVVSADATDDAGKQIVKDLKWLQKRFPEKISIMDRYSEAHTHLNYAGADLVFSPSQFEPCGLVAPIGILHGTPCVGRSVGGMCDIIRDGFNGFLFDGWWYDSQGDSKFNYLADGLYKKTVEAHERFQKKDAWHEFQARMIKHGRVELSWTKAAKRYEELYRTILDRYKLDGHYRAFGHFG